MNNYRDYVTKPFILKEVTYQVKAQLKRLGHQKSAPQDNLLKIGNLVIDVGDCRALIGSNLEQVFSRKSLYEAVWIEDSASCDSIIMVHINRFQKKSKENSAILEYLLTVRGFGYKLVNPYEK